MVYSISVRCSAKFAYYGEQPATLQITINYTGTLTKDCTYYTNTNEFGACLYKASELTIQNSTFTITADNSAIPPVSGSLGNGYQPPNYDYWEFTYPYSLLSVSADVLTTSADKYADVNSYLTAPPSPPSPYMDVDVYTTGAVANKVITVKWDNIQDLPPDMYSSSYLVRIGAYYTTAVLDHVQQSMELATVAYREKFYQTTWLECCNAQPDAHHGEIENQGWFLLTVDLGHHENSEWIVDAQYVFKVEQDGTLTNQTDPDYSGLPQGHSNTDPRSDDEYGSDGSNYVTQDTGQALSIDNLLTKSYALTDTELIAFGQWLWANDLTPTLYANQVSPIENILSCKRIPFDVASGSPTTIWLGNINSGKSAKVASTNHRQVINSTPITIPSYTHDFLDMQNNISIYLPYCGIQSIPTGVCYKQAKDTNGIPYITGRSLKVEYVFDMIYGSCIACVYIDGVLHGAYNGMCGVDIPLTQSNRASNELSMQKAGGNMATGIISSVLSGALGGIGGGIVGAATGAITGAITSAVGGSLRTKNEAVNMEAHYTTSGGFSSQVASYMPSNVTLIVEHTLYTEPGEYAHENGYPCNLCLNMSNLSGYTELDGSIEISNIQCLEEERALLKQALQEGFYL